MFNVSVNSSHVDDGLYRVYMDGSEEIDCTLENLSIIDHRFIPPGDHWFLDNLLVAVDGTFTYMVLARLDGQAPWFSNVINVLVPSNLEVNSYYQPPHPFAVTPEDRIFCATIGLDGAYALCFTFVRKET